MGYNNKMALTGLKYDTGDFIMFIDRARIYVEAGAGGDGMSSFRRE